MTDPVKHWSMVSALKQITRCDFECVGGPLANNDAWRWLVAAAKIGPEFWPGQGVYYEVSADVAGTTLTKWMHFHIVGCHMESDTERRLWTYDLSNDPPGPWHYGTIQFHRIPGGNLRLEMPAPVASEIA